MRLVVPFPDDWEVAERPGGWVRAVVPGHSGAPDLLIAVSPVRSLPAVIDGAFFASELGALLEGDARLHIDDSGEQRGARGWPVTLVRGAVLDDGAEVIERRLAAIYRLLDRYATALLIGSDPVRWTSEVAALGEIVLGGDLDWSGPPASLSAILDPD